MEGLVDVGKLIAIRQVVAGALATLSGSVYLVITDELKTVVDKS